MVFDPNSATQTRATASGRPSRHKHNRSNVKLALFEHSTSSSACAHPIHYSRHDLSLTNTTSTLLGLRPRARMPQSYTLVVGGIVLELLEGGWNEEAYGHFVTI
ncbi:hypothetical protein PSPO01_13169 [Paraphaeosphaeria sporulosa]